MPNEMPVTGFHAAVFVRSADVHRPGLQLIGFDQFHKAPIKDLFIAAPMRHRTAVVQLQALRQAGQRQSPDHFLQRLETLRSAHPNLLLFRISKHRMAKQMLEALPTDRDLPAAHTHPIHLRPLARFMHLREEHLLFDKLPAPVLHPTLQGPQVRIGKRPFVLALQPLQHHGRRHPLRLFHQGLHLILNPIDRIATAPANPQLLQLRRQAPQSQILRRGLTAHPRGQRRLLQAARLGILPVQLQTLPVRNHPAPYADVESLADSKSAKRPSNSSADIRSAAGPAAEPAAGSAAEPFTFGKSYISDSRGTSST